MKVLKGGACLMTSQTPPLPLLWRRGQVRRCDETKSDGFFSAMEASILDSL